MDNDLDVQKHMMGERRDFLSRLYQVRNDRIELENKSAQIIQSAFRGFILRCNLYQEMGCLTPFLFQMHAIERFIGQIPMFYTYITMCQYENKEGVLPRI